MIKKKVKMIISEVFKIDESDITAETSILTVQLWDSLNHLKLIVALEKEFNLTINDSDIVELLSFNEIIDYIKNNILT